MYLIDVTKKQLFKELNKKTEKILLSIVFAIFIILTILWLPTIIQSFNDKTITTEKSLAINMEVIKTFDWKGTITWLVGIIQSILIVILTWKKILGKNK